MAEAKRRKAEVEYRESIGSLNVPKCQILADLLREYVALYGKTTWSISMYRASTSLIDHYILPVIGGMKLNEITPDEKLT